MNKLLIDTDIIIDYFRGVEPAMDYFLSISTQTLILSAVTIAELYAGVREGKEKKILANFFDVFEVFPITHEIAMQGGVWRRDYGKSHGTGIVDAIIAATAKIQNLSLVTLNKKHYPMLNNLFIPYQKR